MSLVQQRTAAFIRQRCGDNNDSRSSRSQPAGHFSQTVWGRTFTPLLFCQLGTPIAPSALCPPAYVLFFFSLLENTLGRFSFVSVSQRIATKACYLHVTLAKPVALEERRLRGFAFCKLWKTVFSVVQRSGKNSDRCKNLHPGL